MKFTTRLLLWCSILDAVSLITTIHAVPVVLFDVDLAASPILHYDHPRPIVWQNE